MPPIETIYITPQGRDQLIQIKRWTGIQTWNVMCRWAFCVSIAEPSAPTPLAHSSERGIEIEWRVFGGAYRDVYLALLKHRCRTDGFDLSDSELRTQFHLHLHRGIAYLATDRGIRHITGLFQKEELTGAHAD